MTPEQHARERVTAAGLRLNDAADRWNAVDLTAIGNCVEVLEQTAGELTQALDILRDASPAVLRSLRSDLSNMKRNTVRLERLTDSSAAFLRCAPGVAAAGAEFYEAGGAIRYCAANAEARGIQA